MTELFLRTPRESHATPGDASEFMQPLSDVDQMIERLSTVDADAFLGELNRFQQKIRDARVVEVIDQLDLLQSVAVQAIGFGRSADRARARATQLLDAAKEVRREPLLALIVDTFAERIQAEEAAPSVGVIRFEGDKTENDRVPAHSLASDAQLLNSITLHPEVLPRDVVQRIAIDVVGVFDRSGVLMSVGRLPRETDGSVVPLDPFPVPVRAIQLARERLHSLHTFRGLMIRDALFAVEQCDPQVAEVLQQRVPAESIGLSASWADVFTDIHTMDEIQQKVRLFESQLLERAERDNLADTESQLSDTERAVAAQQRASENRHTVSVHTQKLYNDNKGSIERCMTSLHAIQLHGTGIIDVLQSIVSHVEQQRAEATVSVELRDLSQAITDPQWSPFLPQDAGLVADRSRMCTYMYRDDIRQTIEQYFDIQLSDVSFRSQMQLLEFLINGDAGTVAQFETALEQDGLARQQFLESFFALAKDSAMGGEILQFVIDANDMTVVNATLAVYADITAAVDTIVQSITAVAARASASVDVRFVTQQLLARANSILRRQMQLKEEGAERLAAVQADIVVFAAICQAAVKDVASGVTVEDMVGVTMRRIAGADTSPELRQQMVQIATENYRAEPHVATAVSKLLHDPSKLSRNDFYVLERFSAATQQQQLLAFVRAEMQTDGSVDLRSLNVDSNAHGAGIAAHFFDHVVDQYRGTVTIHGAMVPEIIAGTHYIEDNGFDATSFDPDTAATETNFGLYTLTIDKDPAPSQLRGLSTAELRAQVLEKPLDHIGAPTLVAQFRFPDEMDAVREISTTLLRSGEYRMTRYIALDPTGSVRLLGFEKNKPSA